MGGWMNSLAQFYINENNLGVESPSWIIVDGNVWHFTQVFHSETLEQKYFKASTDSGRKKVELLRRRVEGDKKGVTKIFFPNPMECVFKVSRH